MGAKVSVLAGGACWKLLHFQTLSTLRARLVVAGLVYSGSSGRTWSRAAVSLVELSAWHRAEHLAWHLLNAGINPF